LKGRILIVLIAMGSALPPAGCGTLCDHTFLLDESPESAGANLPMPYGGVRNDARSIACTVKSIATLDTSDHTIAESAILGTFLTIDLPFSAIADTIALPITLHYAMRANSVERSSPKPPTADVPIADSGN
jgi:uncharacterized protein YceK